MLLARRRVATAMMSTNSGYSNMVSMLLAALLTLACISPAQAAIDETISEHEGKSVVIPCPVNKAKCGDLHSINWFKGDDRIAAMLLGDSNVTSVSDEFANRVTVDQNPFRLIIKDLKISDEDIYLCDTTFLIPIETCDNFNGYRVELNVLVPPTEVVILDEKGDRIENGSIIGPMQERQTLKATCVVRDTRPQPQVGWWRGNKRLMTHSASYVETDGLFTATLELTQELSRDDLARDIECRVESAALPNKLINKFRVDLQVRPTSISINGVEHHTVQGSKVVLTCDVHGARPAVNLTWYNSSAVISPEENELTEIRTKAFEKDDGTYHTQSELIFNATRFENDMIFRCDADNVVLQLNREKPFTSSLTLEVLYPPVVKVSPPEITVNTSDTVLLNCEYVANPASLTQVVWYRNGDLVNVNDTERYEGGNSENVALVIRATDKEDVGNYTCQLSNVIGKGISEQQIDLDVQFAPIVEVLMIPEGPVKESDESNVTLYCNILEANPAVLTKVRWYANATLLKELPDCEETKEDLCHIDPSKLLLESIGRGFFYNYSCEGYNAAGWGPRSEDKELMVHYEPGPATLTHFPLTAVKKKSVTFSCSVDDPGYPESNRSVKSYEKNTAFASSFNSINPFTKSFASTTKSYSTPTNPTNAPQIGDQFHIHFHTVQALQPSEAEAAYEALIRQNSPLLDKHQQQHSNQTIQKETHTLIGLNNQTPLCTLLTLTTFSPKSQILTLYNVAQPTNMAADISLPSPSSTTFSDINSSLQQTQQKQYHQLSLYRKMGSFTHRAQMLIHPHRFRWLRGGRGPLQDIVTKDWTVEPVGLDSRTNYSCYAYNEGGKGVMATVDLVVHAPPFFIKNLVPYTGMLHTSRTANLTCRIECVPRCEITWLKGTEPIELNDTRYFIKEKYVDASPATGDFESMLSVLHFNMSNWPNQKFDIESDSANYTCVSTGNTVGPGIKSSTYFSIEYAPDNSTVSEEKVYVQEGTIPGRVICNAKANPSAHYSWFFNNTKLGQDQALIINTPMTRNDSGVYTCVASNKHGRSTAETIIDVQFKPRCEIERHEIDDQDTLICTAFGNPLEADFSWSIKAENDSAEWLGSGERQGFAEKSFYVLDDDYAIARTYRCVANNTVGPGTFCEIEVAEQLAWWQRWDKTTLIILIASILALLLAVIIICCIIICICRRRRRQDKYRTDVSISATHSVLSYQSNAPQVGVVAPAVAMPSTQQPTTGCLLPNLAAQELPQLPGPKLPPKSPPPKPPSSKIPSKPNTPTHATTLTHAPTAQATTPTRTPSLRVRHAAQAPKSPPRWPLRPGVMVHVSSDTKENLATNRMTLRPHTLTAQLSNLTALAAAADSSTASSATLNASGFSVATTQTTLLNVSTQTANSVTTNDLAVGVVSNGVCEGEGVDLVTEIPKQTSTLGRFGGRLKRADGVGSEDPNAVEYAQRSTCQTLPHKFAKSAQRLSTTCPSTIQANANANNPILTVENANADEQQLTMLTAVRDEQNESAVTGVTVTNDETITSNEEPTAASAEPNSDVAEVCCTTADKRVGTRRLGRVEKFLTGIFKRRGAGVDSTRDSQRSHVGLLGGMWQASAGVLWQRRAEGAETAEKSPFGAEHRLKGIRCSGSVTYKKSPVRSTSSQSGNPGGTHSSSGNCNISNNNNNNNSINNHTSMPLSTVATTNASAAAELNANFTTTQSASNITTTVTTSPTAIVAAKALRPHQSPPAMPPPMQPRVSSPRSPASVTFQVPSFDRTQARSIHSMGTVTNGANGIVSASNSCNGNSSSNNNNCTTLTRGRPQQLHRGILKSPTPPPRPPPPFKAAPPPIQKRNVATVTPTKVERVQIQDKSSSLGDPLTEPGEYENLPFHGLQTAPNKFSTTLTNFNNNTNVVRVAPRPKRLNGNIGQQQHQHQLQQHYEQDQYDQQFQYHQHHQQQQQQQQHHQLHQQYNTMQYVGGGGRVMTANPQRQQSHTMNSHSKGMMQQHHQQQQQHMLISVADGGSDDVTDDIIGADNTDPGGSGYMNGSIGGTAPHQITYNLNNCFPKSYTEYYHQQQQQKHKNGASNNTSSAQLLNAIEHDCPTYAIVERNTASAAGLDPSPIHADGAHNARSGAGPTLSAAAVSTNPFLAISNFKKYDTGNGSSPDNAYQPHILDISNTGSMQRTAKRRPMLDGCKSEDKKFYSLKFSGGGGGGKNKTPHSAHKSPASGFLNASMIMHGGNGGKCKRHHSFAGGSVGDIDSAGPGAQHNAHQVKSSALMRFYDPPAYENLSGDNSAAVQVHECAVEAHPSPAGGGMSGTATILLHPQPTTNGSGASGSQTQAGQTGHKKKHHHRQHQQKDDFNLIEPERLSIYRSDSGISNSSYECVTPVPPPPGSTRTTAVINGHAATPKTPKGSKLAKHASTHAGSGGPSHSGGGLVNGVNYKKTMRQLGGSKCNIANATASGTSLPVYMNVDGQPTNAYERSCSPSSGLVNSSYESASSSQNDGHGGPGSTDPTSLSSCNSLYSSGTGTLIGVTPLMKTGGVGLTAARCGLHQKPAEVTTPEEYEQYQLGHHRHSASSLSVASTVSASGTRRCKKQQSALAPAGSVTGIEHYAIGVTNPFAANKRCATAAACAANAATATHSIGGCSKKLRRKTISDPYAHIRYITHGSGSAYGHANHCTSDNGALERQAHAHNYCAQSACCALEAAATATSTASSQQQQIRLQQHHDNNNGRQRQQQYKQSLLIPRKLHTGDDRSHDDEDGDGDEDDVDGNGDHDKKRNVAICKQQQCRLVPLGGNAAEVNMVAVADAVCKNTAANAALSDDSAVASCIDTTTNSLLPHVGDYESTATTTLATAVTLGDYLARRPVMLPLRKYHSFHFQPSQTVAGTLRHCKLQQLRMQMQHKQQQQEEGEDEDEENQNVRMRETNFEQSTQYRQQQLDVTVTNAKVSARPTKRYAIEGGPLVFRPLSWHEQRTFKPISSPVAGVEEQKTTENEDMATTKLKVINPQQSRADEEEEKSEMSEELAEEIKQITRSAQLPHVSLNPAASLEALEALTKHHPELIYATKPGTRQNLHKQLALPQHWTQQVTNDETRKTAGSASFEKHTGEEKCEKTAAVAANDEDDEEDLGYSFCEDYDDDDCPETVDGELLDEARVSSVHPNQSSDSAAGAQARAVVTAESPRVVLSAGRDGGHVKYMLRQSYREVHI